LGGPPLTDSQRSLCNEYKVAVRESQIPGAGWGLFTLVSRRKGDTIAPYHGTISTVAIDGPYVVSLQNNVWIDAAAPDAGIGRFANCLRSFNDGENNADYANAFDEQQQCGKIIAFKKIDAGAEVFVRYGNKYKWDDSQRDQMARERRIATQQRLEEVDKCSLQRRLFRGIQTVVEIKSPIGKLVVLDDVDQLRPSIETQGYVYIQRRLSQQLCDRLDALAPKKTHILTDYSVDGIVNEIHRAIDTLLFGFEVTRAIIRVLQPPQFGVIHTQRFAARDAYKGSDHSVYLIRVMLTTCSPYTGGTLVSPGSHKNVHALHTPYPSRFVPDRAPWVGTTFHTGDILFLHPDVVHGYGKSLNDKTRKWVDLEVCIR